jgi:hypothetical protein
MFLRSFFFILAPRNTACSPRACLRASFTVFSPPSRSEIFYGRVFYPIGLRLSCLLAYIEVAAAEITNLRRKLYRQGLVSTSL